MTAPRTDDAAPPYCRLIIVSENLPDFFGTRAENGDRLTFEWGEPDKRGWYTPTITHHADDNLRAALLADIRERLPALLDHHWLSQGIETGIAYCTCGAWSFDARSGQHPLPVMGERFAPFSEHVALAIIAELDAS